MTGIAETPIAARPIAARPMLAFAAPVMAAMLAAFAPDPAVAQTAKSQSPGAFQKPVSYTHLTLPTIYSV